MPGKNDDLLPDEISLQKELKAIDRQGLNLDSSSYAAGLKKNRREGIDRRTLNHAKYADANVGSPVPDDLGDGKKSLEESDIGSGPEVL